MRIVSGRWGGRVLKAPPGDTTRPTLDAHRETLFNVLTHRGFLSTTDGAIRIFDFFSGTGALSLEAVSRVENLEKSKITFFENNSKAIKCLESNIVSLMEHFAEPNTRIVRDEKFEKWFLRIENALDSEFYPIDLILCDPPYKKNLVVKSMQFLEPLFRKSKVLAKDCHLVIEVEKEADTKSLTTKIAPWSLVYEKTIGITKFLILNRT